jgi:hypothetical protein
MSSSPTKGFHFPLQPAPAWTAILGLALFLTLGFLLGAGRLLILAFPAGSLAVGIFLYQRYPIFYVSFTWWMWFIGPFVRRLIDYQSGYLTPGPWILTPLIVTSISFVTLVKHLPKSYQQGGLPFILCFGSVFYGFLLQLIQNPLNAATIITLLDWLSPILFGFHLFINWRDYPKLSQNIQRTFVWGVLVMGSYGIYQYLVAPVWDRFWLTNAPNPTYGTPEPLGIRVWSTMMIPQKFAAMMMAGLLLLFSDRGKLRNPATVVGYLAFLLTSVRAAWLSWFAGFLIFIFSLKARLQMRLIVSIMVAILFFLPLTTIEPFSTVIGSRLASFSNTQNDTSYAARLQGSQELLNTAISEFFGRGLGSKLEGDTSGLASYDNGLMVMLLSLGWFGTIPYLSGIFLLLFKLFQGAENFDTFAIVARAIAVGTFFVQIGLNPVMNGEFAMPLWGFIGIGMAAHKYYLYKATEKDKTEVL